MAKFETRAQAYGVKPRTLAAKTRTALARAQRQIEIVGALWGEVDGGYGGDADYVFDRLTEMAGPKLDEALAQLKEPWGGGDE